MSATGRNRYSSWTPKQHHHAGRGDLAGQLGEGVEAPAVVEHAEQADQPAGDEHADGLRVVERPVQHRQPRGDQDRAATPRYMATPPPRGVGITCTSRSRGAAIIRSRMAAIRTTGVAR